MCRDTAYKLTDGCIRPKPRPTRDDVNQNHDMLYHDPQNRNSSTP